MPPAHKGYDASWVMTWQKATPKLIVCVIFDLLRLIFNFFWLFGPLLIGAATAGVLSDYVGGWLAGLIAGLTAVTAGIAASAVFVVLGTILSIAVGLLGWLTIVLWLTVSNPRIFHTTFTQKLLVLFGWGVSELPLLGALPMMTVTVWRMYHRQIKHENHTAALARRAYDSEQHASAQARMQQILAQREAWRIQNEQQAARPANDNTPPREATNDNEIPARPKLAA